LLAQGLMTLCAQSRIESTHQDRIEFMLELKSGKKD